MRLLTLIYEFPPLGGGGGRVANELARQLVAQGHKIDIVTMRYRGLPRVEQLAPNLRLIRVVPGQGRFPGTCASPTAQ